MKYFLGVDVGGSKSHALIADETGQALGFAAAGGANHEVIGFEAQLEIWKGLVGEVFHTADLSAGQLRGAGFGVGGYDWPSQRQPHLDNISALGIRCPVGLVNDAVVGLLAGATEGWGIGVIAGSGSNCWGIDRCGRLGQVTGCGDVAGEVSGAGTLLYGATAAISRQAFRRGPETRLTQAFLELSGQPDGIHFMEALVRGFYRPTLDDVRVVFKVAQEGDSVALGIMDEMARGLADLVLGVARQLDLVTEVFDLVLVGSLWKSGEVLVEPFRQAVQTVTPGARIVPLPAPPVVGGVILAMQQAGELFAEIYPRLIETANHLISSHDFTL